MTCHKIFSENEIHTFLNYYLVLKILSCFKGLFNYIYATNVVAKLTSDLSFFNDLQYFIFMPLESK